MVIKEYLSAGKDKQVSIMSLVCKVCCNSLAHMRNKARLRGIKIGSVSVDNYADGIASFYFTSKALFVFKMFKFLS